MSDPVTNIEIEDVLSSIRRLVSDESRASGRAEKEPSISAEKPAQPVDNAEQSSEISGEAGLTSDTSVAPALVLTPELRIISEPDEEIDESARVESETNEANQTSETALFLTQRDAVPVDDPLIVDQAHQSVSVETVDQWDEQSVTASEEVVETAPFEAAGPFEEEDIQDDRELSNTEALPEQPVSIEDKIAALETLISRSDNDFEPDSVEVGGNAAQKGQALPWEDSAEQRSGLQIGDLPDPETSSQEASFNEDSVAFQQAHAEAVDAAQAEIEVNAAETLLETEDMGAVLDEETLRDMVSEIVRQELQGPLGERITRNVRKLVRREIYRAIAANELN